MIRRSVALCVVSLGLFACSDQTRQALTPEAVEEAYTWGLPIVAMYRYTVSMGTQVGRAHWGRIER